MSSVILHLNKQLNHKINQGGGGLGIWKMYVYVLTGTEKAYFSFVVALFLIVEKGCVRDFQST